MVAPTPDAATILRVLADLAPNPTEESGRLTIPTEWFHWLPLTAVGELFAPLHPMVDPGTHGHPAALVEGPTTIDRDLAERLAAVDQLRPALHSIRVGWLFVAGRLDDESGRSRRVFHPLVSRPVTAWRPPALGSGRLRPAGDVELSERIDDPDARERLEKKIEIGGGALDSVTGSVIPQTLLNRLPRLRTYALDLAASAGLPTVLMTTASNSPDRLIAGDDLRIVAGVGVYTDHDTATTTRAGSLRAWAAGPLEGPSAFRALYLGAPRRDVDHTEPVRSPSVLTEAQTEAVLDARHAPVSLVSGAPGTGKSHTIAAIATDALERGETVLVAAKADATVAALIDLFERIPGPQPIVFGSSERREDLADLLAGGRLAAAPRYETEQAATSAAEAWRKRDRAAGRLRDLLAAESLPHGETTRVPADADLEVDLDRALAEAAAGSGSLWTRWRAGRRRSSVLGALGLPRELSDAEALAELRTARALRARGRLEADGGLTLDAAMADLALLDDAAREAQARHLAAEIRAPGRLDSDTLPTVAALATALRSGRAARRQQLARLDHRLTRALPLWLGSLGDIEDLLPARSDLFDLVIIDEASSVDQLLAAPALLRGRRAVVVGDPRQLRHVSFLSDERTREAIELQGIDPDGLLAARLDLRRNSVFDAASAVAPVRVLDEHFRSDPHLVDFVTERIYRGEVEVATRRPSTHGLDCIRVVRLDGERASNGVVAAEVDWCIAELRKLRRAGARSIGIISPFRAQAEALEEAVLDAFTAADLEALDLRLGTVHAFQGNERNYVIASLGLGAGASANSWRFAQDPHLFAVLATRARRRMSVLVSGEVPDGLIADYLARADTPAGPPEGRGGSPWAQRVGRALDEAGVPVVIGYPTGHHVVDVACRDLDLAIECDVHPAGPEAHLRRRLELADAGWRVVDAHRSRWEHRLGELVVHLLDEIRT